MLITVTALLCLVSTPSQCIERTVTDQATLASCTGGFAQQALSGWMEQEGYTARGYRLAKWGCVIGGKRTSI
jgi:hypothetical protein